MTDVDLTTPEGMLAREGQFLSKKCTLINVQQVVFTHEGTEHQAWFIVYSHPAFSNDEDATGVRFAVYADGKALTGGIIA